MTLPELQARNNNDVPLMLYTGPELQESYFATTFSPVSDDSLVIEAYVDANGRVQDYRIISDPTFAATAARSEEDADLHYVPSGDVDGTPTPGHAVLSFSKISVRG